MKRNIFIVLITLLLTHKTAGLKCYTCSTTENESDTTCATDPASVDGGVTDCDKKYCVIIRVDYKDPRGKLESIMRTCIDTPIYLNEVVEDETHRAYYRSCRTDLCNSGTGRTETTDSENGAFGDKSTIYVPGTGNNGANFLTVSTFTMILAYLISNMFT